MYCVWYRRALTRVFASLLMLPTVCMAAPARVPAKPPSLFGTPYRAVLEQGAANRAYAGVAVGLIEGDRHETLYFGHSDAAQGAPPDADSQFEVGAVSEVFAGLLLAQAALEGKLRLSDPISKFLPQDFPLREPATGRIALDALITQRSTLPPQPLNLFPRDLADPFADYAAEDLLAFLAYSTSIGQTNPAPGYSVLNTGLLGHLLGRVYGVPYAEALHDKVLGPLGLAHITLDDAPTLLAGNAGGETAPHWHYGVLAAAAGLRATLPDLVVFLQQCLAPGDSPLRSALLLARQARAPALAGPGETVAPPDQAALGWNVRMVEGPNGNWPLVWRASETAGFAVFLGFRTDKQKAIVLLGNAASDLAELGMAWLNEATLLPEAPRGAPVHATPKLDEYAGLYQLASREELIVRLRGDHLRLQLPGVWPQRLRALDRDSFVSEEANSGITFMRDPDAIDGLVLHRNGTHMSARRLSQRAPRLSRPAIKLRPAQIEELRGDWRIDPDLWLRVGVEGEQLTLQAARAPRLVLQAYAPDRLADADGAVEVAVQRDAQGHITQLALDLAGATRIAKPLHPHANMPSKP